MPSFTYKAKDRAGNLVDGVIDASDSHGAAGKIREMGYWPIQIVPQATKRTSSPPAMGFHLGPIWTGVSVRSLAVFFRQLATLINAGMSISEALDQIGRHKGMGRLSGIACRAADHVRSGGMLSEALSDYPHIFTPMQLGMIRAGERAGGLDMMIERIATYL
jgi:type II secretory pathway component PulF